jgi:hypothetical protein
MMNALLLILALSDPASCPMHAQHMKDASASQHAHQASVDERGDQVMGFSHEKTKHTFRLLKDGGAVEVRANEASDAESVSAIRDHMKVIAREFANGDFARPREIHGRVPDGAEVMKELGSAVTYRYEEIERGARVRISTGDARGLGAIHAFLKFQIADHHTGDPEKIE